MELERVETVSVEYGSTKYVIYREKSYFREKK